MDINNISNRTIFRMLTSTAVFMGAIALAFILRRQLLWVGTAFFLAVAINPLVERFRSFMPKKNRGLAAGLAFALLLAFLALVVYLVIPPVAGQTQKLFSDLPGNLRGMQESNSFFGNLIDRYDLVEKAQAQQQQILSRISSTGIGVARGIFSGLAATFAILTFTFFMLLEGPTWLRRYWSFLPKAKRAHQQRLASEMYQVVAGYVTGRLLIASVAGFIATVVMTIVGIPFAISLGLLVALFDLLPLIGATMGALAVVTIALFSSVGSAAVMAVFFLIYQQLENSVLQPLVDSRTVQLSPLLVLLSAIIGVSLGGVIGALLAIPTAGCLQVLAKDYLKHFVKD